jgi:hypothetical protein
MKSVSSRGVVANNYIVDVRSALDLATYFVKQKSWRRGTAAMPFAKNVRTFGKKNLNNY